MREGLQVSLSLAVEEFLAKKPREKGTGNWLPISGEDRSIDIKEGSMS